MKITYNNYEKLQKNQEVYYSDLSNAKLKGQEEGVHIFVAEVRIRKGEYPVFKTKKELFFVGPHSYSSEGPGGFSALWH
jgi:hypothetical protein